MLPASVDAGGAPSLRPLAIILLIALAARVPLWLASSGLPPQIVDAQHYNQLALNLLEYGAYVEEDGQPASLRPPLYPFFLTGIYAVFGPENWQAVRAVQGLLGVALAAVAYLLARRVYSHQVGLWTAGFVGLYPAFLGFGNLLLAETLFALLLTVSCLLLVIAVQRGSLAVLASAGAVMAVAALARSILWLFPPVLAVYLLAVWKGHFKQRLVAAVIAGLAFVCTIAPWSLRTSLQEGTFLAVDAMGGRNFMMGNYEHTPLERSWATISLVQGEGEWYRVVSRKFPEFEQATQGQRDKLAMRYGLQFVAGHPALTLQRSLIKFFDFWQLERTLVAGAKEGLFGRWPLWAVLLCALAVCGAHAAALFAGTFGVLLAPPREWRIHAALLLLIAFVCGLHSLTFAHSRYMLPLMPLVLMYAAAACHSPAAIWRQRRSWRFLAAIAICLVFAGSWVRQLVIVDSQQVQSLVILSLPDNHSIEFTSV